MVHYEKPQKFKHRYFINYDENGDMINVTLANKPRFGKRAVTKTSLMSNTNDSPGPQ